MADVRPPLDMRKLSIDDVETLSSWIKSEEDLIFWGGPFFTFPLCGNAIKPLIGQHRGCFPSRECWAVLANQQDMIGTFQIAYNYKSGQADLGRIIVSPKRRGQGIARPLLKLAVDQAFKKESVHRLELRFFTENAVAIAAYRRAGFVYEGTRRESARLDGRYLDTAIMGLLRHERLEG